MPKHKLALATIGLMALPSLVLAGYPDVPRSHWAAPAVDKVGQTGVMAARSDGRFHGTKPATRYEVAAAVSKAMAELENRMVSEGRSPEDIVPYIERINLYVADEIDHLKQAQKEIRATLNEVLERLERREAHSTPMPPPAPPMAHPHRSPTPHTELRSATPVHHGQKVHAVEGAATVNTHTSEVVQSARKRVKEGKIRAVEGGIEVSQAKAAAPAAAAAAPVAAPAHAPIQPLLAAPPVKAEQAAAAKDAKKIPSDEAAWDQAPATGEPESDEALPPEIEASSEAAAAAEAEEELAAEKSKAKPAAKPAKAAPAAKTKASKPAVPRAAPVQTSRAIGIETTLGAAPIPQGAPAPFAAKAEKAPAKSKDSKPAKKAAKKATKDKAAVKTAAKPVAKDVKPAAPAGPSDEEMLGGNGEVAPGGDEPSEEQLANWRPSESGAKIDSTVGAATITGSAVDTRTAQARIAGASATALEKAPVRTDKAASLLAEMRAKAGKK